MTSRYLIALTGIVFCPAPAAAQTGVEILVAHVGERNGSDAAAVDLRLLNAGDMARTVSLPDRVEAQLTTGDQKHGVWLTRDPATPASLTVVPGGFAAARYSLSAAAIAGGGILAIPAWGDQRIALARPMIPVSPASQVASAEAPIPDAPESGTVVPPPPPADRSVGNAFLGNLSAYEPIYAVYGPGTNTQARIQFSFKYQLFGSHARDRSTRSFEDGLYFAYTQRMFWDLGAESSPFRNIDYQPELFYLTPAAALSGKTTVSGQIGVRHESNGRSGDASRSINSLYVAPMAAFSLGGDTRLVIAPRLWLYLGDRSDNPDIRRYRGNSGLFMEVGEADGLRLSTSTRFNVSSGKGALAADLSYPLRRILGGGPDFYLFGQSFIGYGENLLDYDKRTTRFRIGVALVR